MMHVFLTSALLMMMMSVASVRASAKASATWATQVPNVTMFGDPISFCEGGGTASSQQAKCFVSLLGISNGGTSVWLIKTDASTGNVTATAVVIGGAGDHGGAFPAWPSFSGWVAYQAPSNQDEGEGRLFVGTWTGIRAFSSSDLSLLWVQEPFQTQQNPAHPTYADSIVIFTFEGGVQSGQTMALHASNGSLAYATDDNGYTLVWPVAQFKLFAYGGLVNQGPQRGMIRIVARHMVNGSVAWQLDNLTYAAPGLWDNPNLDVDSKGHYVYMYTKPRRQFRDVYCLQGSTGEKRWSLPTMGTVLDYDTYAYEGDFFRLYTVNTSTMAIERFRGENGSVVFRQEFDDADSNSILLVAGGWVFSFGLSSNVVKAFNGTTGAPQWALSVHNPSTGVVVDGTLVLGSANGTLVAMKL